MAIRNYTLTIDEHAGVSLTDLAQHLRDAGFHVTRQLEAIGVIVGRADEADVPRLRALRGVAALEEERTIGPRAPGPRPT